MVHSNQVLFCYKFNGFSDGVLADRTKAICLIGFHAAIDGGPVNAIFHIAASFEYAELV